LNAFGKAQPNNSFERSADSAAFIRQLERLFSSLRARSIRALGGFFGLTVGNMNKTRLLISPIIVLLLTQNSFGQSPIVDGFINSYVKANNFSGTILIQKDSKLSYAKSFGLANRQ